MSPRNPYRIVTAMMAVICMLLVSNCGDSSKSEPSTTNKAQPKGPEITWRDLSYVDTVAIGDTIDRNFVFYNTGYEPVVIKHAIPNRSDCTCQIPKGPVPVGEQDTVKLRCIFADKEDKAGVEIIVEHNTPQPFPTLLLIAYPREAGSPGIH
jgi:hypothetical protein